MADQAPADLAAEAERRRKADATRPPGAQQPLTVVQEHQAWIDALEADFLRGNNNAGLVLFFYWYEPGPAWQPLVLEVAVTLALEVHHAKLAGNIDQAIQRYNENEHDLPLPQPFRRYTRKRPGAWPRGRSPLDTFDRNVALAREAFQWRLTAEPGDWQRLATPAACIGWTRYALTATLDLIEAMERQWSPTASFDASDAWRDAHKEPSLDVNRLLARGVYREHFHALLVDHVAMCCRSEWQRRLAADR